MATEALTRSTITSRTMYSNNAQTIDLGIVRDEAGDPIDISSGWVAGMRLRPGTDPGWGAPNAQTGTFNYGADGTLSLTVTAAQSTAKAFPGTQFMEIILSDDAFATYSTHIQGRLTLAY